MNNPEIHWHLVLSWSAELGRRQILVDFRPGAGIRIAPHFYTSDDEIAQTIHELQSIVQA